MLHSSSYARITQESRATNLRSYYAEVTQFLRRDYAVFTQQLRRFTQPLRNHYAKFTQSLRKVYAIQLRSITQFITQLLYAIALRNCFTQLFYAIVLRNCFTQLFYAFLRMSVNEKFTQKSCNLRKGQLADGKPASGRGGPMTVLTYYIWNLGWDVLYNMLYTTLVINPL